MPNLGIKTIITHSKFQRLLRDFLLRYGSKSYTSLWGTFDVPTILSISDRGRYLVKVHLCYNSIEKYPFIALERGLENENPGTPPSNDTAVGDEQGLLYVPNAILNGQFQSLSIRTEFENFTHADGGSITDAFGNEKTENEWFQLVTDPSYCLNQLFSRQAHRDEVNAWKQAFRQEFQVPAGQVTYTNLDKADLPYVIGQQDVQQLWYTFGFESNPSEIWTGSNSIRVIFGGITSLGVVLAGVNHRKAEHTYP